MHPTSKRVFHVLFAPLLLTGCVLDWDRMGREVDGGGHGGGGDSATRDAGPLCEQQDLLDDDKDGFFVVRPGSDCATPSEIDCDDDDFAIHPGAFDACANAIDEDCDGLSDEGMVEERQE